MPNAPHHGDGARSQPATPMTNTTNTTNTTNMTPALLDELAKLATSIGQQPPASTGPLWGAVHKLLLKARLDPAIGAKLVMNRDAIGLAQLVSTLRGDAPPLSAPVADGPAQGPTSSPADAIDPEILKQAMRAFRKRIKLLRLDQESSLGVGPMSSGRKSEIDAIIPPREFPLSVWVALADAGKLRRAGPGFFELVGE